MFQQQCDILTSTQTQSGAMHLMYIRLCHHVGRELGARASMRAKAPSEISLCLFIRSGEVQSIEHAQKIHRVLRLLRSMFQGQWLIS